MLFVGVIYKRTDYRGLYLCIAILVMEIFCYRYSTVKNSVQ